MELVRRHLLLSARQALLIRMGEPASSLAYCTVTALRKVLDGEYAPIAGPRSTSGAVCHQLAARSQLRTADLQNLPDLPLARWPYPDGSYPDGAGVEVRNLTQLFQLIALGRSITTLPESSVVDLRHDLAAVPVLDAPLITTVIAWPPLSRSRSLADLARVATRG